MVYCLGMLHVMFNNLGKVLMRGGNILGCITDGFWDVDLEQGLEWCCC